jgi:hypothetical protein
MEILLGLNPKVSIYPLPRSNTSINHDVSIYVAISGLKITKTPFMASMANKQRSFDKVVPGKYHEIFTDGEGTMESPNWQKRNILGSQRCRRI